MHAQVSGTIDFRDPDDEACLERLRRLVGCMCRPTRPQPVRPFRAWPRPASAAAAATCID